MIALSFTTFTGLAQNDRASAEEQRVLDAEDEYVAAELSRDEATLRRIIDDRFVFNSSDGTTTGREKWVQSIMSMSMVDQTIRERSVLTEGNVALVFGTAAITFAGKEGERSVSVHRYTSTYVNRDGAWKMLALQMQRRASEYVKDLSFLRADDGRRLRGVVGCLWLPIGVYFYRLRAGDYV